MDNIINDLRILMKEINDEIMDNPHLSNVGKKGCWNRLSDIVTKHEKAPKNELVPLDINEVSNEIGQISFMGNTLNLDEDGFYTISMPMAMLISSAIVSKFGSSGKRPITEEALSKFIKDNFYGLTAPELIKAICKEFSTAEDKFCGIPMDSHEVENKLRQYGYIKASEVSELFIVAVLKDLLHRKTFNTIEEVAKAIKRELEGK